MKTRVVILFSFMVSISSCIRDAEYPIEPHLEFKSVASTSSVIYMSNGEPIYQPDTITVSFTDGDGDIGYSSNGIDSCNFCGLKSNDSSCLFLKGFNVFVIDSRDSCMDTYRSADIETTGKYNGISGEILILHYLRPKDPTCFTPSISCPKETLRLKIKIRDKAGHISNEVETPPITLEVKNL